MSAEILFMMNSHSVNDAFMGSALECYGDIDLDNVKQIEFVSCPASSISLPGKRKILNRYLNWNTQLFYRGNWSRSKDDPREDPGDYAIVNTTLIAKDFISELKGIEVRGSVLNLFNKDYTSPTGPGELPYNYPMPGINFLLELRYTF